MTNFEIPKWEENTIGDNTCDAVFKNKIRLSKEKKKKNLKAAKSKLKLMEVAEAEVAEALEHFKAELKYNEKKQPDASIPLHNQPTKTGKKKKKPPLAPKQAINMRPIPKLKVPKQLKSESIIKKSAKLQQIQAVTPLKSVKLQKPGANPIKPQRNATKLVRPQKNQPDAVDPPAELKINSKNGRENRRLESFKEKLRKSLQGPKVRQQDLPLRQRMMEKLKGARFRYLNEQMYTTEGGDSMRLFRQDPAAFQAYHEGYRQQVTKWPLNPLDTIIKSIRKMSENCIVADFGCGEARLASAVSQTVYSFDFVAVNDTVTECDMAKVPLENGSADVAVFCLSLMGTNLGEYLSEANRVLKPGGILKIAEVESRFDTVDSFVKGVEHFGFKNVWRDLSHNLFYFLDFKKEQQAKKKGKLPTISLHPCLYKKR